MKPLRFAYLTDTHFGCDDTGYRLQARYLGHDVALFQGLARWLRQQDVAFVVHGGDVTDHGSKDEIDRARELCAMLRVPVHACLGNHDLAQENAMNLWRAAKELIPCDATPCYSIDAGPVCLIVVNHHWHPDLAHHWDPRLPALPRLDEDQLNWLRTTMSRSDKPVIAITHAPLNAVPAVQCGGETAFHPPSPPYLTVWQQVSRTHPNLRLALCGHNHAHSQYAHGTFISCTTAAFNETPCQLRLITVHHGGIELTTHHLASLIGLPPLDAPNICPWCVGEASDHTLNIPIA